MRRLVLVLFVAGATFLSSAAALAVNRPGWAGEVGGAGSKRHMDILIEGLGDGTHEWRLSYVAPCQGPDKGVVDDGTFYSKRNPQEAPLHVTKGRFVLRRHYKLPDGRDIHWTLAGHRSGKLLVGTFRVHTVSPRSGGEPLVCDAGLLHWIAHRDSFAI